MAATGHRTVAAILVAGGAGRRLGAATPKAFCKVSGLTLLEHAYARFSESDGIRDVIAVVPAGLVSVAAGLAPGAKVVSGGTSRQASVAAGLAALADDVDTVLVHDVARPFVPAEVIDRVLDALRAGADAVIPAVAVTDTIKQVLDGAVVHTFDRASLVAVQTPQGFARKTLEAAHATGAQRTVMAPTDDAGMVEAGGTVVVVVDGSQDAFKITTAEDLARAEGLVGR